MNLNSVPGKMRIFLKKSGKYLCYLLLLGILTFGTLLGIVLSNSHDQLQGEPEIMIILGCLVEPQGPSQSLADRLDKALEYWESHPGITIIVSGGQGSNEPMTEAKAMHDYLVARGVPSSQIYQEGNSSNTHQNLTFTVKLMEEEGLSGDVLIVSSGFHLGRAKLLWGRVGGDTETLSLLAAPVTHVPSLIHSHIRESFAIVKSFLFDQGLAVKA